MKRHSWIFATAAIFGTLGSIGAFAQTQVYFPRPDKLVINAQSPMVTLPSGESGVLDPDAETLYEQLNVAAEGGMVGSQKRLVADNQGFQMNCTLRQGAGYTCILVIGPSPHLRISPNKKTAEYAPTGDLGVRLRRFFKPNDGEEFHFYSSDGKLEIHGVPGASPAEFRLFYRG